MLTTRLSKAQMKMDNFFLKKLKKCNSYETNEQKRNTGLNPKEILKSPEHSAVKAFQLT